MVVMLTHVLPGVELRQVPLTSPKYYPYPTCYLLTLHFARFDVLTSLAPVLSLTCSDCSLVSPIDCICFLVYWQQKLQLPNPSKSMQKARFGNGNYHNMGQSLKARGTIASIYSLEIE